MKILFLSFTCEDIGVAMVSNSNWIEWSTIQGVIGRVISKSAEREITSPITPWIVRHEVQLPINRNYKKNSRRIWQLFKLFDRFIRLQLCNYKRMTCATVQLRLKSGLLMTNQIREFWYSCDYVGDHNYIKILESDWSSAGLISAVIVKLHTSCACNCTVVRVMPE